MTRRAEAIKILYTAIRERWAGKLLFWIAASNPSAVVKAAEQIIIEEAPKNEL